MEWNLLAGAQLLFFGLGAWYFWKSSRRKGAGEGLRCEDNIVEMDKLMAMEETKLTEPLAEQTRPRTLEEIIGQENGIKALRAALCGPNPQHILIYGPPGVGKTAAARLILEEAKKRKDSPFKEKAKFVEIDATTLQFDERNIADPLLGSVHDPIYQGAGAFGNAGIPRPRPGAVCEAHGGVLFIDEIGELHPVQMNKLLKELGKYSMDIYIMANIFQVCVRVVLMNKLGVNGYLCFLISFVAGIIFPVVISKNIVRKIPMTNKLVLGNF